MIRHEAIQRCGLKNIYIATSADILPIESKKVFLRADGVGIGADTIYIMAPTLKEAKKILDGERVHYEKGKMRIGLVWTEPYDATYYFEEESYS